MIRILVVEDGQEALERLDNEQYDLILLDVMLPQMDGFELMDFITPLHIPVIFLTAKNGIADRVKGLRMGAEDYIVKPFDVMELLARVEVVLRRYNKSQEQLSFLDIEIDIRSMRVMKQEIEVSLTPKEYELLLLFARNPNTALYRETIYERVWGGELEYGSKTVDLHVQRLRKKLGLEQELQAINKVGYRFEVKG
jgi:DNA-binding response OmpR family regulator